MLTNDRLWLSPRRQRLLLLAFLLAILALRGHGVLQELTQARGWEYEWVAGPLASGHGYSFEQGRAWLGPYSEASHYSATAWVEPLHTFIMAASFRMFGEYGRLILVLLNFFWVGAACWVIFLIVDRILGFMTGMATAALYALLPFGRVDLLLYIGPAAMSSCVLTVCALLLIRCLERVSLVRSVVLGATIGIANITHAGSLLFAPIAAAIILAASRSSKSQVWKSVGVVLITTILVVSPWILRNYVTFDQLVTVRTGFGFQLYIGNPGLAQTFIPGLQLEDGEIEAPWTAAGPRQALALQRHL